MAFVSQQCQPGLWGCIHMQLSRCVCFLRAGVFDGEPKADNPLYQQQATKIVQSPTEKLVSLQFLHYKNCDKQFQSIKLIKEGRGNKGASLAVAKQQESS